MIRRAFTTAGAVLGLAGLVLVSAQPVSAAPVSPVAGQATTLYTYPAGWSDATEFGGEITLETSEYKAVAALQYYRSSSSTDAWATVTAVQGRCAIRKLGSTTGVRIDVCVLGIDGGAGLRSAGPFYDNGTCCANGTSGLRYVQNPPSNCCTGFAVRISFSYRTAGTLWGPYNLTSPGGAHVFNLVS